MAEAQPLGYGYPPDATEQSVDVTCSGIIVHLDTITLIELHATLLVGTLVLPAILGGVRLV